METAIAKQSENGQALDLKPNESAFSIQGFDHAQRIAKALAEASLVPDAYKKNISNCLIALEMSNRIGASPLMVMQNLHIIQGRPSWSSPFIIASLNTCGRFKPLKFRTVGEENTDTFGYEAYTTDKSGDELIGPKVTWAMVKAEGWLAKNGSKWKTMPDLMFRYRAAAFFGRLYAPDILMGMQTVEEVVDITPVVDQMPEDIRDEKEKERVTILLQEAKSLSALEELKPHLKTDEQLELFESKKRSLS